MKKLLALLLALVLVLSLVACGNKDNEEDQNPVTTGSDILSTDEQGRSVVRVGIQAAPTTLAPWEAMSYGGIATRRSIYEFLVDKTGFGGDMVGIMMKSYEKVDDTTYNLTIYDYIYDTEGNHLTADDVIFSYETAQSKGNLTKLMVIEEMVALDQYTVQFRFERPMELGELETLWSEAPVVTKAAYEAAGDGMTSKPVGTSPYRVVGYAAGASITLEKTGNYWQTDESLIAPYSYSNVDVIKYVVISEPSQMTIALETGTIDISANISATDVERFDGVDGYKVSAQTDNTLNVLLPNCSDSSPLSNQALREAVFYAVDSQSVLDAVYGGEGLIAKSAGSAIYGDFEAEMESDDYFGASVEKAKQKLAEAGYQEGELTLDLLCQNATQGVNAATIIQGFLGQIGINVKIHSYENAMFQTLKDDPDEWDLALDAAGSSDYLINLWKLLYDKDNNNAGGTGNFVMDDELQELLDAAATVEGHTKENMLRINEILTENAYVYALFNSNTFIAHTDAIETVCLDFRKQVMAHCCTYNTSVESVDSIDDILAEDPQPVPTEEPDDETPVTDEKTMGAAVDAAAVAGTYKWSIDPGFGFVMVMTGTLNADGTYKVAVTGLPNGDMNLAGTFVTDGENVKLVDNTGDTYDPSWGIQEDDGSSWWIITGADNWCPRNHYTGPAMEQKLSGSYAFSIDPGFGFTMTYTGTFNEDGTYTLAVTGLPNGDMNLVGTYVSDGEQIQLVTNDGDAYDPNWGIEEEDGSSWWVITGDETWIPRNYANQ